MRSYSLRYYIMVWMVLFVIFVSTIIKVFVDHHPLRFVFIAFFLVGLLVGYFRYVMRRKSKEMRDTSKFKRYGIILLFILIYMMIKTEVSQFITSELSGQDYGVVFAFFILGLFISYYGFYSFYLWNSRQTSH